MRDFNFKGTLMPKQKQSRRLKIKSLLKIFHGLHREMTKPLQRSDVVEERISDYHES